MVFVAADFSFCISVGGFGGPGHDVSSVRLRNGVSYRTARRAGALRAYEFGIAPEDESMIPEIQEFVLAIGGAENSFLFSDPTDYSTNLTDPDNPTDQDVVAVPVGGLGAWDGTVSAFYLKKEYRATKPNGSTVITETRPITKPVADSVVVRVEDGGTVIPTTFSVSETSGIVQLSPAPTATAIVSFGCRFYTHVAFDSETSERLSISYVGPRTSTTNIGLTEISPGEDVNGDPVGNEAIFSVDYPAGGSLVKNSTEFLTTFFLNLSDGRLVSLDPGTTGLSVILPDSTNIGAGAGLFDIINNSTARTFDVLDFQGNTLETVPISTALTGPGYVRVGLAGSGANKQWVVLTI